MKQERLLSHNVSLCSSEDKIQQIIARIRHRGDTPNATVAEQLAILSQLQESDFCHYLLENQGINGYWTHYMVMHARFGKNASLPAIESFLLNKAPVIRATQQRFEIFSREIQKSVKNNATLACIPCGMMGELLYLNFDGINHIQLVGIDYDMQTFQDAQALAEQQNLAKYCKFMQQDAWDLANVQNEFDLISSNGLNVYEPDNDRVTALYRQFYQSLKSGGKLVISFLTWPPTVPDQCEWDMSMVNTQDLLLQKIIFTDIMAVKWQCFRSTTQTMNQLHEAGFKDIQFNYDDAKIFPTAVACKE